MSLYYTTMDRQLQGYDLMYYPMSYLWHFLLQTSIFVYNFYSGVNFCGKNICGSVILWELIFADCEKTHKNRKN